jgi:hypothetical protein
MMLSSNSTAGASLEVVSSLYRSIGGMVAKALLAVCFMS